jgi:hypothetical protein
MCSHHFPLAGQPLARTVKTVSSNLPAYAKLSWMQTILSRKRGRPAAVDRFPSRIAWRQLAPATAWREGRGRRRGSVAAEQGQRRGPLAAEWGWRRRRRRSSAARRARQGRRLPTGDRGGARGGGGWEAEAEARPGSLEAALPRICVVGRRGKEEEEEPRRQIRPPRKGREGGAPPPDPVAGETKRRRPSSAAGRPPHLPRAPAPAPPPRSRPPRLGVQEKAGGAASSSSSDGEGERQRCGSGAVEACGCGRREEEIGVRVRVAERDGRREEVCGRPLGCRLLEDALAGGLAAFCSSCCSTCWSCYSSRRCCKMKIQTRLRQLLETVLVDDELLLRPRKSVVREACL